MELNKYSKRLTQDVTQPASQAMLYGVGLTDEDMKKAQVGIVSTGYEGNTCNMHLNGQAELVKKSVVQSNLVGLIFNTIGVSDGISNGTKGMRYSLLSREIIADSIEAVAGAHYYDALITVVGCDKNMPGAMMALGRLNRPGILLYGGTIFSGCWKDKKLNIVSAFEALGEKLQGTISDEDYKGVIKNSCPSAGACGGMYTANTMSSAIEAMGMSIPYSSSNPALSPDKTAECNDIGKHIRNLMEKDIKPRDIVTKKALENAVTVIVALGGSTNATLHLPAIAHSFDIEFTLDDIQRISDKTPYIADLKPSGKFLMEDLYEVGGVPAVMKYLLEKGFLHGDCMTVTGKTIAENLAEVPDFVENQKVIVPIETPIKPNGHLQILYGNLATKGCVAKITGKEGEFFEGPAVVFDGEEDVIDGISKGKVKKGSVVVIRYEGPKGAPGMPEMLKPTSAIVGAGLAKDVALITDGRFSGGSHGFVVGHVSPEAQEGGTIALVQDGDIIRLDAINNTIDVLISEEELATRKANWQQPKLKATSGALLKYAKLVSSADKGCVTDL
ncbi:MAG: dihydroxy-acid dehydratase [Saprospiraceae bacterium]